jgi:hypothetical protein
MTIRKALILFLLIFLSKRIVYSQTAVADTGKVTYVMDDKIKSLEEKHLAINEKAPIMGYRVKIHFGSDKNKAKEVKGQFIAKYPNVPAYEKYDQPNFNIRVGDFRTKLEAYKFLKQIQGEFPTSFLVQDEIEIPKLDD